MAQGILVEDRIDTGLELLAHLVRDGFDVTASFWVKTSEEGVWLLYIGSNSVSSEKLGKAYRRVDACMSQIPNSPITLSDIKFLHGSNPVVLDAIALRERHPGRMPTHYHGNRLGNLPIQEAYIYPVLPVPGRRPGGEERRLKSAVPQVDRRKTTY